ncbi:SulP family inorganic anion transporter [Mycolicibacterium sp. XJ870]
MTLRAAPGLLPYRRDWLRADVLAGLATGAVVIPQAMAYATVANMPVQIGLYTCMVPLVVYAFIGGSRTASVTSTSTIATLTASTMVGAGIVAGSPDAQAELITLTLLVGLILLAARLLKLGSLIESVNEATLVGIKAGVGLTVAAAQLPKLLGVQPDPEEEGFFRVVDSAVEQLAQANLATVLLSAGTIVVLVLIGRFLPSIPGPLIVVALGIGLVAFTGLSDRGVTVIPEVPRGIPLPGLPALDHIGGLIPGALAIALMAFLETVSVARGVRKSSEPQVDPDRELSANGLAAVLGSFFHALPPAGGFSQTGVNLRAGARTQVSGLVTAALAVLVAVLLAPVLSKLPEATLGAMVLVAVVGLIDLGAFKRLYVFDKVDFAMALIVALFGLTAGLLPAVAVGVLLTLYLVLRELNRAHVVPLVRYGDNVWVARDGAPGDPLVLRFEIGLYSANLRTNSEAVREMALTAVPHVTTVVLDLHQLPLVTSTILDGLRDMDTELAQNNVRTVFANMRDDVHATAQRWPWWQEIEKQGRYFDTLDGAVAQP